MNENNYMSKEYTNCVRGIFAILVVVHHIYQKSGFLFGTFMETILRALGYLCVAMFFFYSGYGLMLSSRKENYLNSFFKKRFAPLYIFYVIVVILYTLWTLLVDGVIPFKRVGQSFLFGGTIITNGWYMQTTFVSYILYFFCFKIFKSPQAKIGAFGITIIAYCAICALCGLENYWFQTIPCMVLGMVFCYKKGAIDEILKNHKWLILILSAVLYVGCFALSALTNGFILFNVLYTLIFVCFAVTLSYILRNTSIIYNKFFGVCGNYSLEIYLAHGFFIRLIKYMPNIFLYIAVVFGGTFVVSILMKLIYKQILRLCKK